MVHRRHAIAEAAKGSTAGAFLHKPQSPGNLSLDSAAPLANRRLTMKTTRDSLAQCCPAVDERPDMRPVEGGDADDELAALAKALGHPARVQILRLLFRRSACICGDADAGGSVAAIADCTRRDLGAS